ncbi:MAG: hypothetical protein JSR18_06495 [Proteobacteria bacterium]|nr:hypothetical protein [Pseudomonadota bacterium]
MNSSSTLSFIVACSALAAAIIAPVVSLIVSRWQFNASVLSANRERWLAAMRTSLSELMAMMVAASVHKESLKEDWGGGRAAAAGDWKAMDKVERMVQLRWNIGLLCSADDPAQRKLCDTLDRMILRMRSNDPADLIGTEELREIEDAARPVLHEAWVRIRKGR